jgi:uncharacterized membrane protein YfhO
VDRPGWLVADVDIPVEGVLALTERFHDGWSATTGSGPLPVTRIEGDFLGCRLQPGTHHVTFRFMPRSFEHGVYLTVLGGLALALVLAFRLR